MSIVSLGTLDTLIENMVSMTYVSVSEDLMKRQGLYKKVENISLGLEFIDDIIDDLKQV